jgi:processive 1,2-diacylglycerol beta-glucosyltransferase
MKVIIAYASAGAGHFKAAQAIRNCFKEKHPQVDVKLVDILEKSTPLFKYTYVWFYTFMVRHAFFLWGWLFAISERGPLSLIIRKLSAISHSINTHSFAEFLVQEAPDAVISTHFAPPEIAAHLKKQGKIRAKLITVITDFGVHPFWLSKGTDLYIGASEFTKSELLRQGVEEGKIKVCGIPVDAKFLQKHDRDSLCKKIGIDKDIFTVLIMTGSFGIGPIEEIVEALYREVQLLVVCASNKKLFDRLSARNLPGVDVFGFVDNADELMAVSDVIVTKPGGLSTSEILVMELAPIFVSAIPGQERGNVEAMASCGIGLELKNTPAIKREVLDYRDNPDKLLVINERIRKVRKPFAAEEICNAVCESGGGAGDQRPV